MKVAETPDSQDFSDATEVILLLQFLQMHLHPNALGEGVLYYGMSSKAV